MFKFPENFIWGVASSAYQTEGGIDNNDWSRVYDAGLATNHYNRYEEDFDLARKLGVNAFRLSFEWARLEPEEGKFSQLAVEHYQKVIAALKKRGLEPWVTLWHFTIPLWFAAKGGFEKKENIPRFERFVKTAVSRFPSVRFWITLNEPVIYANDSYILGKWPPQKRNFFTARDVINNLAAAHQAAYQAIKEINGSAQIGIANHSVRAIFPVNWWFNRRFLDKIRKCQDFVGINYYFGKPEYLKKIIAGAARYGKPIYITENGVDDPTDFKRRELLKRIVKSVGESMIDGKDVRGYFHWSLTDNIEWERGAKPRFGLVEIDYQNNLKRIPRPSFYEYANIIHPLNPKP